MPALLLLLHLLSGAALAGPELLVAQETPVTAPGDSARVLVLLHEGGAPRGGPPPGLTVEGGVAGPLLEGPAPGLWTVELAPTRAAPRLVLEVGGQRLSATVPGLTALPPGLTLVTPEPRGWTGQAEPVILRVRAPGPITPSELQLAAPEGRFGEVTVDGDALVVPWWPGPAREPRVVPLGLRDAGTPGAPPLWVTVRLSSRAPVTVNTEPGTRMTLSVGGRRVGPVVAGADGQASATVEVRPGEAVGEAVLEDAVGNRQRSTLTLIRDPRPGLVLLVDGALAPGAPAPALHVRAIGPAGAAWSGAPPRCVVGGAADALQLHAVEPGVWVTRLEGGRDVACELEGGRALAEARVVAGVGAPVRVGLTAWPEALTADLPVAQLRAWVEDARGQPLPPEGLTLSARGGALEPGADEALALRAELRVDEGVPEAEVLAGWRAAPVGGQPARVTLGYGEAGEGEALAFVRAVDRAGRPVEGAALSLAWGAREVQLVTDARGYASARVAPPADPVLLVARAGGLAWASVVAPWWSPPPLDPDAPDLQATRVVPVAAGRISRVAVVAEPSRLYTGGGATAWIEVRLTDRAGTPVTDESVRVEVSEGEVEALTVRPDGALRALYRPPTGAVSSTVEVRVRSERGAFPETSTRIELVPRPVSWAPGLAAGLVTSFGDHLAFHASAQVDRALPLLPDRQLYARLALGYHRVRAEVTDPGRGGEVDLQMDLLPVSLSALMRRDQGAWSGWTGAGLTVTPYRLEVAIDGEAALAGRGLHSPGPLIYVGGGRRLTTGEVFGELRGQSVVADAAATGFDGQVGGFVFLVGYRILY